MNRKQIILMAVAALAFNAAPAWAQSVGGSQSERSGESQTPVPPGRSTGTEDPSKVQKSPRAAGQSNKDTSIGGSQSKRDSESDAPVSPGRLGSDDPSKVEKSTRGVGRSNKDTSIGGSQSKRSPDSQTPLLQGSRSAGSDNPTSGSAGQQDIRQAQEALKNQGHDPGPIDGVMGPQTREALKAFQTSNGLKQTGMLDAETKQKLNIHDASTRGSAPIQRGTGSAPMGR
jgi:hypothetical protein